MCAARGGGDLVSGHSDRADPAPTDHSSPVPGRRVIEAPAMRLLWLSSVPALAAAVATFWVMNQPPPDTHPAGMTVPAMIGYWGYKAESHEVTTEDGYVLTLHRVLPANSSHAAGRARLPVLLFHCLLCSSAVFAFGPPERSLAFLLADAGHDVWLANARGNTWSRRHTVLDSCSNCTEYWNFSFEELGRYDIPAEIDYILAHTGFEELFYVGYSMGSTAFLVAAADRPEYNAKVRAAFLMGPAAFLSHAITPFTPVMDFAGDFFGTAESFGFYEVLPHGPMYHFISSTFCSPAKMVSEACFLAFSLLTGVAEERMDRSLLPLYVDHLPGGSNTKTVAHYAQLAQHEKGKGRFCRYDHGKELNMVEYGSESPPDYELSKVTTPTYLFAGSGDQVVDLEDTRTLERALPNAKLQVVPVDGWTHCDFFVSTSANNVVYNVIMGKIADFET